MRPLTKPQAEALIEATARAGLADEEAALRLGEELVHAGLLVASSLAYMRGEDLGDHDLAARFETRVEVAAT